ncbi:hypothetical protein [Desulfatiglans anilini]|uniref:hypothetical protein n=1 Tax=Desulfatiglans anilini TaxID=90728 RepID=UPI00040EABBD|nr:hypothetical protein [Desulfatiglans anilini]
MKGSLSDQLAEALALGELKIEPRRKKIITKKRQKITEYVPPSSRNIMDHLLQLGRDEKYPHDSIPSTLRNVKNFIGKAQRLRDEGVIPVSDFPFALLGYARWNESAQLNQAFRNFLCDVCFDAFIVSISEKDCSANILHDMDNAFAGFKRLIDRQFYNNVLSYVIRQLDQYDFDSAERILDAVKRHVPSAWLNVDELVNQYSFLRSSALKQQIQDEILRHLEQGKYREADSLFKRSGLLSLPEYEKLTIPFIAKDIMKVVGSSEQEEEHRDLASDIFKNEPEIVYEMTWERLRAFIVDRIGYLSLPRLIYRVLTKEIAKNVIYLDDQRLALFLVKVLNGPSLEETDYHFIWGIFLANLKVFQDLLPANRRKIDNITSRYPFDRINEIVEVYLPPEEICLKFLKREPLECDSEQLEVIGKSFQKSRYFNCSMVVALLRAKIDGKKIRSKDILRGILQAVVNKAFNYNLETKNQIRNFIFPRCISDFIKKNFMISDRDYVFCEGILIGEESSPRVLCRGRKCEEMTRLLCEVGNDKINSEFLYFLRKEFNMSIKEFFSNENFSQAMGSFNRWNEIAYRLVCGYGEERGCGSPLLCNSTPQVKSGWAAYAVTYWRCSNEHCEKRFVPVKLSHCGSGCGKIIDSRFDKIACKKNDSKPFYICRGCGFCCKEHGVSGICPNCGESAGWDTKDPYLKWYSCRKCGHTIGVPNTLKGCLGSENSGRAFEIQNNCCKEQIEYLGQQYDDVLSDFVRF